LQPLVISTAGCRPGSRRKVPSPAELDAREVVALASGSPAETSLNRRCSCQIPLYVAATLLGLAILPGSALANRRPCLELEQSFAQIEQYASSIEINIKLFGAARLGCEELAERLLDKGASLEARDGTGSRPLAHAAANGQVEIVTLFLDKGAAIDARDLDGSTALFKAAENGRMAVVSLLVEKGANVNVPGRSEVTPVAAAAYMGSEPIVKYLIEKGATSRVSTRLARSLVYAAGRGFTPVARLLLDHGVDVNARYGEGLTALMGGRSFERRGQEGRGRSQLTGRSWRQLDDQDDQGRTALMLRPCRPHGGSPNLLARGLTEHSKTKR
jgi:ankyrin repeat protein